MLHARACTTTTTALANWTTIRLWRKAMTTRTSSGTKPGLTPTQTTTMIPMGTQSMSFRPPKSTTASLRQTASLLSAVCQDTAAMTNTLLLTGPLCPTPCLLSAGATPCDIQIEGVDSIAPALLGGLDGVYKVATCGNGRPMYRRETADNSCKFLCCMRLVQPLCKQTC